MTSLCPQEGLRLAYHSQLAPLYSIGPNGQWKGLYVDYWNDVARMANCGQVIMKYYEVLGSEEATLLNGDILNGQVFSSLQALYFLKSDPFFYSYTTPAKYYKMMILEKSALGNTAQVASIWFFVVFPLDVLLLFCVSCKIIDFIEYCFKKCRSIRAEELPAKVEGVLGASDLLRYALFSFSIVFLVQQWSGYFNGNNLLSINIEGTTFSTMSAQFHQNKRQLVADSYDAPFKYEESLLIFGGNSTFLHDASVKERFRLTCEQPSRVGIFPEYEYYVYLADQDLNEQCKLAKITLSAGEKTGVDWLDQTLHDGNPYSFLVAKNGTRKIREIMDFTLMSVYSEDNLERFLLTRNMPISMLTTIERQKTTTDPQLKQDPMSLTALQFPLIFLIVGLIASVVGFILERIVFACRNRFGCCQRCTCCV